MDRRREALGDFAVLPDEMLCSVLGFLDPGDIGSVACVSSVFYILCNEEPLWMRICLSSNERSLVYKGSWKRTAMERNGKPTDYSIKPLQFNGFTSLYLYRRWYRCNVSLSNFFFETGDIERRIKLSAEDFVHNYDMKKPVLLPDLTEDWPARQTWTVNQLVDRYGDVQFKVSQSYGQSMRMTLRDYADYMKMQHDEDPLYIFDSAFGEAAPGLLEDYKVPDLFKEDLLSILNPSQRPPYRWLVIGPARSGANWHVDPALTSAWNTLLYGRKRWAFYPPGRVPPGVYVNVDEDDGEVHYDSPSSLQWWLDVYPTLDKDSRPLECTQLPGETIFVPSGWWHCVLNIDETVAVTQNFVNSRNLELVCIDLAPGFHHRGVARAGSLALDDPSEEIDVLNPETLKKYVVEHPDFLSETNSDGLLNRRDFRDWLYKLQIARPDLKPQIWKCACVALDAHTWLQRLVSICKAHNFIHPNEEQLPIGNGSSPVYLLGDYAIKIYVHEDGIATALREVDSELRFYASLEETDNPLKDYIPSVIARGIIEEKSEGYHAFPVMKNEQVLSTGISVLRSLENKSFWPYLVTKRCEGQNLAQCRNLMKEKDYIELASFLGHHVRHLHSHTLPSISQDYEDFLKLYEQKNRAFCANGLHNNVKWTCRVPKDWEDFVDLLREHRQTLMKRLKQWDSVPRHLLQKVEEYVPKDPVVLIGISKVEDGIAAPTRRPVLLHMDIMEDNIQMVSCNHNNRAMQARYIFDFGDLRLGDPLYELIPLYNDVLEVNSELLQHFLGSYKLQLSVDGLRTSYRAMCYCLLYKYDAMETIFQMRKDLRTVETWEELEFILWAPLNEEDISKA